MLYFYVYFPFINILERFEAEHHFRALGDLPGVEFYMVCDVILLLCCYALLINVAKVHKRQNPEQLQNGLSAQICIICASVVYDHSNREKD